MSQENDLTLKDPGNDQMGPCLDAKAAPVADPVLQPLAGEAGAASEKKDEAAPAAPAADSAPASEAPAADAASAA